MPDFSVHSHGVDSSGRAILCTDYMWDVWTAVVAELGFTPTIVQGAFMAQVPGGGAADSAGYHDQGGCFDLRTWDLSPARRERVVRVLRKYGAAAWRRDERHGMDQHIHFVLGTDRPLSSGAASQWQAYIDGRDGLSGGGKDYEWRPSPLVLTPPEADMPLSDIDLAKIRTLVREEVAAELDRPIDAKNSSRSVRQMVKELWNNRNS